MPSYIEGTDTRAEREKELTTPGLTSMEAHIQRVFETNSRSPKYIVVDELNNDISEPATKIDQEDWTYIELI